MVDEIVDAIRWAEKQTSGEIRVHLKPRCKEDVLGEARKVFAKLGMHKTQARNGVLIFVALRSRRFAILGDVGIHERVGDDFWQKTRDGMADYFAKGQLKEGIVAGVISAGEKLKTYFPVKSPNKNELSDEVTEG